METALKSARTLVPELRRKLVRCAVAAGVKVKNTFNEGKTLVKAQSAELARKAVIAGVVLVNNTKKFVFNPLKDMALSSKEKVSYIMNGQNFLGETAGSATELAYACIRVSNTKTR